MLEAEIVCYDEPDAHEFYRKVWGGEHIHVGLYLADESIALASEQAVRMIAGGVHAFEQTPGCTVLDLGSGFGGPARLLAREYGCRVIALDASEQQNLRNGALTKEAGLCDRICVVTASGSAVPLADESVGVVWSQEALLHFEDRDRAVAEAARVLKEGGELVFTDPLCDERATAAQLAPVLERLRLRSLASASWYLETARRHGLSLVEHRDLSDHLTTHYRRVLDGLRGQKALGNPRISRDYCDRMLIGLKRWVDAGQRRVLRWGMFHFAKLP
jgi:SAM-dependent methyltransferase